MLRRLKGSPEFGRPFLSKSCRQVIPPRSPSKIWRNPGTVGLRTFPGPKRQDRDPSDESLGFRDAFLRQNWGSTLPAEGDPKDRDFRLENSRIDPKLDETLLMLNARAENKSFSLVFFESVPIHPLLPRSNSLDRLVRVRGHKRPIVKVNALHESQSSPALNVKSGIKQEKIKGKRRTRTSLRDGGGNRVGFGMDMLPQMNPTNFLRPHPVKLLNPLRVHPGLTEPVEGNERLHPVKRLREIKGDENPSLSKGLFQRKEGGPGSPARNPVM